MRPTLTCLFALVMGCAAAQFNGKLVYQIDNNGTRTVMTYIQNGTNAILEAYTATLKNGAPDTMTMRPQDTILYDFTAGTETHLQFKTGRAYKTSYITKNKAAAAMPQPSGQWGLTFTSTAGGSVNGYTCNHYVITNNEPYGTGTKDVWTTNAFAGSPTLWVVGSFLYFTPGYPHFTKLTALGASGVVVRVNESYPKQNVGYSMNLVFADPNYVPSPAGFFNVPSRYTLVD